MIEWKNNIEKDLFCFEGRSGEGGFAGDGIAGGGAERAHESARLDAGRSGRSVAFDGLARHLQFLVENVAADVTVAQIADLEDVARALQVQLRLQVQRVESVQKELPRQDFPVRSIVFF